MGKYLLSNSMYLIANIKLNAKANICGVILKNKSLNIFAGGFQVGRQIHTIPTSKGIAIDIRFNMVKVLLQELLYALGNIKDK